MAPTDAFRMVTILKYHCRGCPKRQLYIYVVLNHRCFERINVKNPSVQNDLVYILVVSYRALIIFVLYQTRRAIHQGAGVCEHWEGKTENKCIRETGWSDELMINKAAGTENGNGR